MFDIYCKIRIIFGCSDWKVYVQNVWAEALLHETATEDVGIFYSR